MNAERPAWFMLAALILGLWGTGTVSRMELRENVNERK